MKMGSANSVSFRLGHTSGGLQFYFQDNCSWFVDKPAC